MLERCPNCESDRLVRGVRLAMESLKWPVEAVTPGGVLWRGQEVGDLRGVICVDCGVVQWVATDQKARERLFEQQQAGSLTLE